LHNHVGDCAAAVGDGAGAEDAAEEAEDDEGVESWGYRAGNDKCWRRGGVLVDGEIKTFRGGFGIDEPMKHILATW
jgi:hypothetical protein